MLDPILIGLVLDWRRPWSWPRQYQHAVKALGVVMGIVVAMPMARGTWQDWCDAREAQTLVSEQARITDALLQETAELQKARDASVVSWGDVSAMTKSAGSPGLEWTQQTMALPQYTPVLSAMQLQQVPLRLQARGSWRAWMQWLERWPQRTPGLALETLLLEVDGREGVRADMAILATQYVTPFKFAVTNLAQLDASVDGPFDAARWAEVQQQQARQHISYNERVVPELRRAREPLEFFARERLHYVGQIAKGADMQALLRVDDAEVGKARAAGVVVIAPIHRVRVGSRVGQHFGRVSAITADALWVKELVLAPSGEWVHRDIQLALQVQVP